MLGKEPIWYHFRQIQEPVHLHFSLNHLRKTRIQEWSQHQIDKIKVRANSKLLDKHSGSDSMHRGKGIINNLRLTLCSRSWPKASMTSYLFASKVAAWPIVFPQLLMFCSGLLSGLQEQTQQYMEIHIQPFRKMSWITLNWNQAKKTYWQTEQKLKVLIWRSGWM